MAGVIFVALCERCLMKLSDPVSKDEAIRKAGGLRDQRNCPRCGLIERVRLLPLPEDEKAH